MTVWLAANKTAVVFAAALVSVILLPTTAAAQRIGGFGVPCSSPEHSQFSDDDLGFGQFGVAPHEVLLLNLFTLLIPPAFIEVQIDIKPGSDPNSINLGAAGVIPVAILSTLTFNAPAEVDPSTLTLAGAQVRVHGKGNRSHCGSEDVNGDGRVDLVCHFVNDLNAEIGDSVRNPSNRDCTARGGPGAIRGEWEGTARGAVLSLIPRVDHAHLEVSEVCDVACGERRATGEGDAGNLRVAEID